MNEIGLWVHWVWLQFASRRALRQSLDDRARQRSERQEERMLFLQLGEEVVCVLTTADQLPRLKQQMKSRPRLREIGSSNERARRQAAPAPTPVRTQRAGGKLRAVT